MLRITQYIVLLAYCTFIALYSCDGFDGKTEECPSMCLAYVDIYNDLAKISTYIKESLVELPYARDAEEYKRALKLWLNEEQGTLMAKLNKDYKSGNMDGHIYDGLFDYIFDTIANLVVKIKEA